MKKFGTPSGAGPGDANEKVGFAAVGTPFLVFGDGGFFVFEVEVWVEGFGPVGPLDPLLPVGPDGPEVPRLPPEPPDPWLPREPLPPEPRWRDGGEELVVVPVVVGVVEVLVVGGGVDVVVVVGVAGAHEALTLLIGPTPAGTIADGAVPAGTLTLKLWVWPVTSVTVTVHSSADAVGIAAIPITPNTVATVAAVVFSFRLLNNLTKLLPASAPSRAATQL